MLIAVAIGVAVLGAGIWGVRLLARPVPEPDADAVVDVAVDYRCSVCGMRLTVTQASEAAVAAPRHCREEMEPV